jgi:hypothetical protein
VAWICFALFALIGTAAFILLIWEKVRSTSSSMSSTSGSGSGSQARSTGKSSGQTKGGGDAFVSPFLVTVIFFCIVRMIQDAISVSVARVYDNMMATQFFEATGSILFLLAFTFIALCWCNIVIRADIYRDVFQRLKPVLWFMWILGKKKRKVKFW